MFIIIFHPKKVFKQKISSISFWVYNYNELNLNYFYSQILKFNKLNFIINNMIFNTEITTQYDEIDFINATKLISTMLTNLIYPWGRNLHVFRNIGRRKIFMLIIFFPIESFFLSFDCSIYYQFSDVKTYHFYICSHFKWKFCPLTLFINI